MSNRLVQLDPPKRKKRRAANDREIINHTRKRLRTRVNLNKQEDDLPEEEITQNSRQNPLTCEARYLERRDNQASRQTRSSLKRTTERQEIEQKHVHVNKRFAGSQIISKRYTSPDYEHESQLQAPPTKRVSGKTKRRRDSYDSLPKQETKRQKHSCTEQKPKGKIRNHKKEFINNWLNESCWSRKTLTDNGSPFQGPPDIMPRKDANALPSPRDSFTSTRSSSGKSVKSSASVHDKDYRDSLRYRNIYVERQDPPVELMRRAKKIIQCPRVSPEIDDVAARELKATARRLQNEGEEEIIQQLAPHIIPPMNKGFERKLARNADQQWSNSVPLPLDPDILTNPLPLPKPKPDLAFGYSETAFSHKRLTAIDLLVDDQYGRSYAIPDQKLRFPFLDVEFKSQARNGTHYVATNQAAGTGAVALNGNLELFRRSFGVEHFDFDEPRFFSITMDHQLACVNVHWVRKPVENDQCSFHVEGLSTHLLNDIDGLRTLRRAIKNILNYGSDTRLRDLCNALDAYREKVISEREATRGNDREERGKNQPEPQPGQRRRSVRMKSSFKERQHGSQLNRQEEGKRLLNTKEGGDDAAEGIVQSVRRSGRNQAEPERRRGQHDVPVKALRTR